MKEDTYTSAQFSQKPILRLPCSVQFKISFLSGSVQFLTPIVCSITPINLPFFASAEDKLRGSGKEEISVSAFIPSSKLLRITVLLFFQEYSMPLASFKLDKKIGIGIFFLIQSVLLNCGLAWRLSFPFL
jgi:hypothetical protein